MFRESMIDYQLQELGLNERQIYNVKQRIGNDKIPLFIEKMKKEKEAMEQVEELERRSCIKKLNNPYVERQVPECTIKDSIDSKKEYQEYANQRFGIEENLNLISIRLFGNSKDKNGKYSKEYLKKKYKELAIKHHPDKNGGNCENFNILKNCYEYLCNNLCEEEDVNKKIIQEATPPPKEMFKNKGFDVKQFNNFYSKNALIDNNNKAGYGDWLKTNERTVVEKNVNMNNFNECFNRSRKRHEKSNPNISALIKKSSYPEESLATSNIGNSELGEDKITDYSGYSGKMQYTDIKRAHESSHLIYNLDELENKYDIGDNVNREFETANNRNRNIPENMNNDDFLILEQLKTEEREKEELRRYRQRELDENISEHFKRVNILNITKG